VDVGVRRVALSRADVRRARGWVVRRAGLGRAAPEAVPGLAELRAARERTARRTTRTAPPPSVATPDPRPAGEPTTRAARPREAAQPDPDAADAGTLAERLARRRRGN